MNYSKLFIPFEFQSFDFQVEHGDGIFLLGSCFSDEIGERFKQSGHKVMLNPFGTLFHPTSLAQNILACFEEDYQERFLERDQHFYSWDCSTKISGNSFDELKVKLVNIRKEVNLFLREARVIVVTLGTSWAYELNATKEIVANCHKAPASYFQKFLSSSYEMLQDWIICLEKLKEINPNLQIIFTVSPVRHIKDGVPENNLSKARLLEIVHQLSMEEQVSYFPSYDYIIDVLRDYRFYKEDGIHPNEIAINYIWRAFQEASMTEETQLINNKVFELNQFKSHQLTTTDEGQIQKHLQRIEKKREELLLMNANIKC